MREHEDFIPELDFVLELDGQVIGNIIYTKAKLIDENGTEKEILTFGPVSIHPGYQRMGYGKMLMEHSFQSAIQLGYDTIVIFGSPVNYVSRGFKSCKKYNVCIESGKYPAAMMVKELRPHALDMCIRDSIRIVLLWQSVRKRRNAMMLHWSLWKRSTFQAKKNFIL